MKTYIAISFVARSYYFDTLTATDGRKEGRKEGKKGGSCVLPKGKQDLLSSFITFLVDRLALKIEGKETTLNVSDTR